MSKQADLVAKTSSPLAAAGTAQLRRTPTAQFVNNRPSGIAQRKMQAVASNSPLVTQRRASLTQRAPVQRVLMTEQAFKKQTSGRLSGKRKEILKVEEALAKCATATSKSVGYSNLIAVCDNYLQLGGRDKKRIAGVTALRAEAVRELADWRARPRTGLPASVFRMDERLPDNIANVGFQPWKADGNITLIEHVTQALRTTRPNLASGESGQVGSGAKKHSQFISTASDLNFAKDPTLVAGLMNKYFYKIDTGADAGAYTDVNEHFDDNLEANPYEPQFEFAKTGGIAGNRVTHYVHGRDLINFVLSGTDASTWNIPWTAMP